MYPGHDYNVFNEPGATDYNSAPMHTWTNSHADAGFTLNLDAPYSSYSQVFQTKIALNFSWVLRHAANFNEAYEVQVEAQVLTEL